MSQTTAVSASVGQAIATATQHAIDELARNDGKALQAWHTDPLAVLRKHGGPVDALNPQTATELKSALLALPVPHPRDSQLLESVSWGCIGCEAGVNAVIVTGGGVAALVIAVAAGPEVLVGSAIVVSLAELTGLTATVVAGIVTATIGGNVLVGLEAIGVAICEATGACS